MSTDEVPYETALSLYNTIIGLPEVNQYDLKPGDVGELKVHFRSLRRVLKDIESRIGERPQPKRRKVQPSTQPPPQLGHAAETPSAPKWPKSPDQDLINLIDAFMPPVLGQIVYGLAKRVPGLIAWSINRNVIQTHVYIPDLNTWSPLQVFTAIDNITYAGVFNEYLFGYTHNMLYVYNTAVNGVMEYRRPAIHRIDEGRFIVVGRDIYFLRTSDVKNTGMGKDCYRFDGFQWQEIAYLEREYPHMRVTVINNLIYVGSGMINHPISVYDSSTNCWTDIPNSGSTPAYLFQVNQILHGLFDGFNKITLCRFEGRWIRVGNINPTPTQYLTAVLGDLLYIKDEATPLLIQYNVMTQEVNRLDVPSSLGNIEYMSAAAV